MSLAARAALSLALGVAALAFLPIAFTSLCAFGWALLMTPVLGLVLGPAAIVLGLVGQGRLRRNPEIKGLSFSRAGIVLGTLDFIVNVAGVTCIAIGLGRL